MRRQAHACPGKRVSRSGRERQVRHPARAIGTRQAPNGLLSEVSYRRDRARRRQRRGARPPAIAPFAVPPALDAGRQPGAIRGRLRRRPPRGCGMDQIRLDAVLRSLPASGSRHAALAALAGGLVVAGGDPPAAARKRRGKKKRKRCPDRRRKCQGACCQKGQTCVTGDCVCSEEACAAATNPVNPQEICFCDTVTGDRQVCIAGIQCTGSQRCSAEGACPQGQVCQVFGCGGNPTCVPACTTACAGAAASRAGRSPGRQAAPVRRCRRLRTSRPRCSSSPPCRSVHSGTSSNCRRGIRPVGGSRCRWRTAHLATSLRS